MRRSLEITLKNSIETGIVLAIFVTISGLYTGIRNYYFAAVAILLITLLIPSFLKPLAFCWFGLSKLLSWFTSRLVLVILFYFLVTPVGLVRRLLGKDALQLKSFKKNKKSAFMDRDHVFIADDLTYPF